MVEISASSPRHRCIFMEAELPLATNYFYCSGTWVSWLSEGAEGWARVSFGSARYHHKTSHDGFQPQATVCMCVWGVVSWDLMRVCVRHDPFHHQQATLVASAIRPLVKFRQRRAFDSVRAQKRAGSIRKQNICSSAASSLKTSP